MNSLEVLENPVVKELMETVKDKAINLSGLIPYVEKDIVLMSPGKWNDRVYTADDIVKAYNNTDWNDNHNNSMFSDHKDMETDKWLGYVRNIRLKDNNTIIGDFYCYDFDRSIKLKFGKMKSGVSPKVEGLDDGTYMSDFTYTNFSHVIKPAVKTAYIYNSEGGEKITADSKEELVKITAFEDKRKQLGMTPGQFYAIPKEPPSASKLPIFDASHVRNALARFNQVTGVSADEKAAAKKKIDAAAEKFGIKVGEKKMTDEEKKEETSAEDNKDEKQEEKKEETPNEGAKEKEPAEAENAQVAKELTEFGDFFKDFKKKNPEATIGDAMAQFKKRGNEEEGEKEEEKENKEHEDDEEEKKEEVVENIDLKGLSKGDAVKVLEEKLEAIKSGKAQLADKEVSALKKSVKEMSQEIKELRTEQDVPDRNGKAIYELADNSGNKKTSSENMLAFLKKDLSGGV